MQKNSERKSYPLSLGSISRDFAIHKIEKTELNKYSNNFCVSYETIDISNIDLYIQKDLMKKYDSVKMPGFIK